MDVRMRLLVNTTDIGINNRQVRLKMYVQGNGIQAQSSEVVVGMNLIYINGGELLTLTNLELAPLFRLENLEGMSPSQYANALPEGLYTVCFELYDFLTNQKISQKSCAQLYLMLNDPPLLNTPSRNESIVVSDFPNILFTWTPRQINATNVSYQFELKEILDPTIDPQIGFLTSPLLYEEELRSTALLYDVSKPNLLPGKRYAWRVRAMSTSGLSLNNVFKNEGYSEIYHFTYASHCPAPTFILSEAVSARSVRVSWLGDKNHTKYHLQYKKAPPLGAGGLWFEVYTMNPQTTLSDLEAGVSYEFRVGGSCEPAVLGNTGTFTYSGINQFSMPTAGTKNTAFTCGLNPTIAIANQTPITNLIVSETFTAGDFPVKILELTGNNPYTGKGYIIVPYLADTKIAVAFNNITVNTNYQLIKGVVETTYNPEAPNISDVEDLSGGNNGQIVTQTVPFVITTITTNPNGDIIVGGANGEQITIPGGSNTVITGGNGQIYNVDSQGNATGPFVPAPGGATTVQNTDGVASNGQASQFTAQGVSVRFEPISSTKYAWDAAPTTAPSYIKEKYAKVGSDYLSYKAVVNGQRDVLKAKIAISDHKIVQDSIIFKTQHWVLIDKEKTADGYLLTLKGTKTYAEEEVQAVIKQGGKYKIINAFRLTHISEKPINVTLIPLNSSNSIPSTAISQMQEVYTKAGVTLNIKTAPVLTYDGGGDNKITTSESGVFDYYTDEEKSINAQIKALPDYDPKTYYLIYSNLPSDKGIDGFMALYGQFGYVFQSGGAKTAAHELAHGVFAIQHPFTNAADKGKTPFLMDYGSGTELGHLDWAQINNPALKYYGFQGDSQGEIGGAYDLDPNFNPIYVKSNYIHVSQNSANLPFGVLRGFMVEKNNQKLFYSWNGDKYVDKVGKEPEKEVLTSYNKSLAGNQTVLLYDYLSQCKVRYMYVNYSDIKGNSPIQIKNFFNSNYQKYSKIKLDKDIYKSGVTYCYQNSTDVIDKSVKKQDVDLDNSSEVVIDYNKVFTNDVLIKFQEKLVQIKNETGVDGKILVTKNENSEDVNKVKEILAQFKQKNTKEVYVWANYTSQNDFDFQVAYSKGFSNSEKQAFEKVIQAANKNKEGLIQLGIQGEKFNPLTAIFDGLASIIRKAKIPERFYNPEIKTGDYNPILYYISLADPYALGMLLTDKQLQTLNINITDTNKVGTSHIYFAMKCGVWNGIVEQVAGLSDTAAIVSDLLSGGDRISELWEGLKRLDIWCTETKGPENVCIWSLLKQAHTGQTCQVAEQVGGDAANVLTIAISFAKVGQVAKVAQLMESLDAMSQVLKLAGKVIKPVLVGTGKTAKILFKVSKAFFQPGVRFTKLNGRTFCLLIPIPIDLTPNLEAAINKAKELLSENKEAFDLEIQIKKDINGNEITDQNGNLVGEITVDGQKIEVLVNPDETKLKESAEEIVTNWRSLVKNVITKRVVKTISKYDKNLGKMVDYPMYNNVALGKSSGGALKQFGDEVGANVWTKETDNVFTSMYDLMESRSFERNISDVFNQTLNTNQGKIIFDVTGVNIQKAVTGGMEHTSTLVLDGFITELELQLIMRNKTWFDNVVFHEGGNLLSPQDLTKKGIKFLEQ
ncbi:hypothetical protein BWK59_05540 [Flavobacterium davisii]|uniref:Fibronectin type-III domain-containing protein n=2 Tax=Flavobacterium davisii TaxID=2906077 RepID=A0A246GJC5_9FLAO|nr:hypothetical protein BWK59_05540 [Flavobacterium davisii]